VLELGRLTGLPTPHLDAVHACASRLAREGGRIRIEKMPRMV
jgi:hypothetical protein